MFLQRCGRGSFVGKDARLILNSKKCLKMHKMKEL